MRTGIDRTTGRALTGWDHVSQSIMDIVTTAVGSRVLARAYGFSGPGLQDAPMSPRAIVGHFSAIADALRLWEPCFRLRRAAVDGLGPDGVATFSLTGDYYPNGYKGDWSVVIPMQTALAPLTLAAMRSA